MILAEKRSQNGALRKDLVGQLTMSRGGDCDFSESRVPPYGKMNRETTRIDLPSRRMIKHHRSRVPRWVWLVIVIFSVAFGAVLGLVVDRKLEEPPVPTASVDAATEKRVVRKIALAREAIADGDWLRAKHLFEEVKELDEENPDALASLPLINRRLDEARGSLEVRTDPIGATVVLEGVGESESPAVFSGIPFGKHTVTVLKDGYEPVSKEFEVTSEEVVEIPEIVLSPSSGGIEVVSEPEGADFKLLKTLENEEIKLVEIGKTPARIEKLDPGEYQVLMAVEGWPEYSENVRVSNNRSTSVSAVFAKGGFNITSDPIGAGVWVTDETGNQRQVGVTPLSLADLPVGKHRFELRYRDWAPISRTVEVAEGVTQDLEFSWERMMVRFVSDPPGAEVYMAEQRVGNGREVTPFSTELPEGEYRFSAVHDQLMPVEQTAVVEADAGSAEVSFQFDFGSVSLDSEPPGAAVVSNGMPLGRTPLTLPVVPPGQHTYEFTRDQYRPSTLSVTVEPGARMNFSTKLKYDPAPVASRDFRNGLGQKMVWVRELNGWVSAYETTQSEFERIMGTNPSYFKAPNHPVDSATWYEASKFAEGLSAMEAGLGNLPEGYRYRLPTDAEWSVFVGDQKLDSAVSSLFDRQKSTAPVGSLAPNNFGLYDVRGNVQEWVTDWYSQQIAAKVRKEGGTATEEWIGTDRKVLRGGAWNRSSRFDLEVGNRIAARPSAEDRYDVGFRVVLMRN